MIDGRLSGLCPRLPMHVVYRVFPGETVVLNMNTGLYHSLNPAAGEMLAALEGSPNALEAARTLAAEYSQPLERVASDLVELCDRLLRRGLIELEAGPRIGELRG